MRFRQPVPRVRIHIRKASSAQELGTLRTLSRAFIDPYSENLLGGSSLLISIFFKFGLAVDHNRVP
jgi:hypothetical protein